MAPVFVSLVGQDDNVGDSLLRRSFVRTFRELGHPIYAHIGNNSPDYIEALDLGPRSHKFTSQKMWWLRMLASSYSGKMIFAMNPGERPFEPSTQTYLGRTQRRLIERSSVRVQSGVGLRRPDSVRDEGLESELSTFEHVAWRDRESASAARVGTVAPDWAFGDAPRSTHGHDARQVVTISFRSDRDWPAGGSLSAAASRLIDLGYRVVVAAQVRRDDLTVHRLASVDERIETCEWGNRTHLQQEQRLRELYSQTLVVLSDRLHVQILAASMGAVMALVDSEPSDKLRRTVAAAGVPFIDLSSFEGFDPSIFVKAALDLRAATSTSMASAFETLASERVAIAAVINDGIL